MSDEVKRGGGESLTYPREQSIRFVRRLLLLLYSVQPFFWLLSYQARMYYTAQQVGSISVGTNPVSCTYHITLRSCRPESIPKGSLLALLPLPRILAEDEEEEC